MRVVRLAALAAVSLVVAAACDRGATQPDPPVVATLWISDDSVSMFVAEGVLVGAAALDDTGDVVEHARLLWSSPDPGIAAVDSAGRVTGVAPGRTRVQVSTAGGALTREVTVDVTPKLQRLSLSVDSLVLAGSAPCSQYVSGWPLDRWGQRVQSSVLVSYRMEDATVARVEKRAGGTSGLIGATVYGLRSGETRLVAWTQTDTATIPVRVGAVTPRQLQLAAGDAPFYHAVGDTVPVRAAVIDQCGGTVNGADVSLSSDQAGVAALLPDGRMAMLSAGHTRLRGVFGSLADSILVTVNHYRILPRDTTVFVGDTIQFVSTWADSTGVFRPWNATHTSSDSSVVRLIGTGRQNEPKGVAAAAGEATITARTFPAARARVRVLARPTNP